MTWKITVNLRVISQRLERFFFFHLLGCIYQLVFNWNHEKNLPNNFQVFKSQKKAYYLSYIFIRLLAVKTNWKSYSTTWITQFLILMDGKRISSGRLTRTLQKVRLSRTWPITKYLSSWTGLWNFSQSVTSKHNEIGLGRRESHGMFLLLSKTGMTEKLR